MWRTPSPPPPPPNPPPGGGGSEAKKKVCVPKIGLKFPAPLINFTFRLRKGFLMWGGGGGRLGLASAPNAKAPLAPPAPRRFLRFLGFEGIDINASKVPQNAGVGWGGGGRTGANGRSLDAMPRFNWSMSDSGSPRAATVPVQSHNIVLVLIALGGVWCAGWSANT